MIAEQMQSEKFSVETESVQGKGWGSKYHSRHRKDLTSNL